jgi:hypothetical protein
LRSLRLLPLLTLSATLVLATAWPRSALAQDAPVSEDARRDAAKAFAEGVKAFASKDYALAARRFEEADRLAPHPNAVWNMARALERAGDKPRAADAYAHYLQEAPPDAHDRDEATRALDRLAPQLVRIDVTAPGFDAVLVDDRRVEAGSSYVDPGHHVVEGHAGDHVVKADARGDAGAVVPITLTLPAPPPPPAPNPAPSPAPAAAPPSAPPALPPSPAPPPPAPAHAHGWSPVVFVVSAGATAALLATAIGLGLDTLSFKSGTYDVAPPSQQPADYSDGVGRMNRTNILFACAGVGAIFTTVTGLWLTDWHGDRGRAASSAAATLAVGPGSFELRGRFR